MKTEYLNLKLTEKLVQSRFSRTDFDDNWKIIDEKMKELSETANVSFEPTDDELKKLAAMIVLSSAELEDIAGNIVLSTTELEKIASYFSEDQMDYLLSRFSLTQAQLQEIASSLSESQLESLASYLTLTEEQVEQIVSGFEISDKELEKICTYFTESQLNIIASKVNLTTEQFGVLVSLFNEEQLRLIASFFTLTEEQIQEIVETIHFSDEDLKHLISLFSTEELTVLANFIEFSEEQLALLKGEPGKDAELVPFSEEQQRLIDLCTTGLNTKQEKLSDLEARGTAITDDDLFPLVQGIGNNEQGSGSQTKLINAVLMAEYIVSKSPIPQVGMTLDDYTKQELWAIFTYGQGENYFEIGDKMTWVSNRLVTTAQIVDFNKDVKDSVTGARANVTFMLNDYVVATETEVPSAWDSSQSEFRPSDISCLASVIQLQEDGEITAQLLPKDMVGLLTHVFKRNGNSGADYWEGVESTPLVSCYMFPLGANEFYSGDLPTEDSYTGEFNERFYSLLSSTTQNENCVFLRNVPTTIFTRWVHTSTGGGLRYLNGSGVITTATSVNATTSDTMPRRIPVGFCMG